MVSPVIALTLISLAIFYSPWFNWTKNALSDLGVQCVAAILFNSGLIISGFLTVIFAIGLREVFLNGFLGHIGMLILILDAAILCAIGVFPKTTGALHFYVSVAFFTLLPISLFLIGAAMMWQSSERKLGLFTVLAGVVVAVVWTLPWESATIPEMLASLVASVWSIVLGIRLSNFASRFVHS